VNRSKKEFEQIPKVRDFVQYSGLYKAAVSGKKRGMPLNTQSV
jgi:hypothetical protein